MQGNCPQQFCHITSGIHEDEGVHVLPGTIQVMHIDPANPKHKVIYDIILQRMRISVPGATIKTVTRMIYAEEFTKFYNEADKGGTLNTAMGFTSSPGAMSTYHEFGPQIKPGQESKRRRANRNMHLCPSPEPPICVSVHAMLPLLVHTAEREKMGTC